MSNITITKDEKGNMTFHLEHVRGFERVTGYEYVNLPERKTKLSAGYDLSILVEDKKVIYPKETVIFKTGLKAYLMPDEVLQIHIRSSLGIKRNLVLSNITGIIDSDYYNNKSNEGHIMIALTNTGLTPQVVENGEFVAQGIFIKYLTVDNDNASGNRVGGIGSTDKENK